MRFLTITCNTSIDTTYLLEDLPPGEINRVDQVLPAPGGKGNNVARVLVQLGQRPIATGFVGGHSGNRIESGLLAAGVQPEFVRVPGESRTCLTIIERGIGRTTEIREPGAPVTEADGTRLLEHVRRLATEIDAAVISGSMPPGLPADFYRHLIQVLKYAGRFVALDTSGDALHFGVQGGPDLVKPNWDELVDLIGPVPELDQIPSWAQSRLFGPVVSESSTVLLSLGAAGAALIRRDGVLRAQPPAVTVANTVGSGDALLAGYLDARARGWSDHDALASAVAVGTSAVMQESIGVIDPAEIGGLRGQVRVTAGPALATAAQNDLGVAMPTQAGRQ